VAGAALAELMPDEPEVHGLLAMMMLHDARREARFRDGDLVLLADQDRALWTAGQIAQGLAALDRALALRGRGPYVVQAAIASAHRGSLTAQTRRARRARKLDRLAGSRAQPRDRRRRVRPALGSRLSARGRPPLPALDAREPLRRLSVRCARAVYRRAGPDRRRRRAPPGREAVAEPGERQTDGR
jgi:RNA polymerase sigma-70 factor (ECF subfamily)